MIETFPNTVSAVIVMSAADELTQLLEDVSQTLAARCQESEIIVVANQVSPVQLVELKRSVARIPDLTILFVAQRVDRATAQLVGIESAIHDWILLLTPTRQELGQFDRLQAAVEEGCDVVGLTHARNEPRDFSRCLVESLTTFLYRHVAGISKMPSVPAVLLLSREAGLYVTSQFNGERLLHCPESINGFPSKVECGVLDDPPEMAKTASRCSLRKHLKYLFLSTKAPVRAATFMGMVGSLFCLSYSLYALLIYLLRKDVAPGWTTLSMLVSIGLFLVFVVMGILSEFIFQILADSVPRRRMVIRRELRSPHSRCSGRLNVIGRFEQDDSQFGQAAGPKDIRTVA